MAINYSKPIEIRDSRNGSWFWIHTHVWRDSRLTQSAKVVYGTIASYSNTEQTAFPSITRISKDSDISERHIYRCLLELQKLNYIKIEKKIGKPNVYVLVKTTPDIMSPLTGSHHTPDKSYSSTPDKNGVLTIKDITRTINNNGDVEKIIRWAYERSIVKPSISKDLFLQSVNTAIDRVGYNAVYEVFANETNAITFLQIIKTL